MAVPVCSAKSSQEFEPSITMTDTNIVMDEEGNVFVPLDTDAKPRNYGKEEIEITQEESVDELPQEHVGENASLQSRPENKASDSTATDNRQQATMTEKTSEHLFHSDSVIFSTEQNDKIPVATKDTQTSKQISDNPEVHMCKSPNSSQSTFTIAEKTISADSVQVGSAKDHGILDELLHKSQNTAKRDQLYPMRNIVDEKDCRLMGRLSLGQDETPTVSDEGQRQLLQENVEQHITGSSIQNSEQPGTAIPMTERDETKAQNTEHHGTMLEIACCAENKPQATQDVQDVPSQVVDIKSDSAQLCPERSPSLENDPPNQRPALLTAPEDVTTAQTLTGITLEEPHNNETQALGEHVHNVLPEQLHGFETPASEEHVQKGLPEQLHKNQMPTFQNIENVVSKELQQNKMPASVEGVEYVTVEQLHENKAPVLMEHIQKVEQQDEKMLENGIEFMEKNTMASVVEVPHQLQIAETLCEIEHEQAKNNPPLETNVHIKNTVDAKSTQTEDVLHETLPIAVSPEMEQSASQAQEPYYSQPPDFQDHLYVQADDIGLQEDPSVRQQVERLDHVTLNIAITGMTGAGKSTFINAVRGIDNDDEKAAPTGATETTMDVCAYPHPSMPNVSLWDLPGTGSPKFKAKKYLKDVKFETYDFFIIISSERFKENDMMLAKEILKKNKKFYFLRSKIDNEVRAEQFKKNFDADRLIACIREDCINHLKSIVKPTVFLVSSFDLDKYDFPNFVDTLIADLPAHKREALILSLPIYSTQMLERKIKSFEKTALRAAKAASGISMAPIPGLAVACDAGILLTFFTKCYHAFGLDDKSLDKLSERVNNHSLKALRESRPFVMAVRNNELSSRELSALGSKRSALEFAYSLVPVWGSKRAASMSHSATLGLLNEGLKELADTAREVLKVAKIDHIKV